jgi:hypothetical protein
MPLKAPQRMPTPMPPKIDKANPIPEAKRTPVTTPDNDMTDPTDKSIPLLSMTAVIPSETMINMQLWSIMLEMFIRLKNLGEKIEKINKVRRNR